MKLRSALLLSAALAGGILRAAPEDEPLPAPLDLPGAILYALNHNYAIREAREQIRFQHGVLVQARSAAIPSLNATGEYQANNARISSTFPAEKQLWTAELLATETIFAGGGVVANIRNAQLERDAALDDLQTSVNAALLDVRTKFYNVILDREQVRVQEENVQLFRRQLRDTQSQFGAGSVSSFEVLRARVSLANAQPDLITAQNNYRIAIEQLRQSLGAPADSAAALPEIVGDLATGPVDTSMDDALASAHHYRPELLRLAKLQEAGKEAVRTSQSTYFPHVSLFGGWEYAGFGEATGGSFSSNGWLGGAQASWSIFDGLSTRGKVEQARSQYEQAKLQLAGEELAVDVDVRQAFSSLQEARELLNATQKTVEQAEEALRLANVRYTAGTATQLDVLTSQDSLTQARTNQLQASYTYLVAVATLRQAMGLPDALVAKN